ncbi:energy-coupling factor transport system substrate-specific component [Lachnospiraceae bacterium PF1-21]
MATSLKSSIPLINNMRLSVIKLVISALLAALLFTVQVALGFLPNIELVSLLIIIFTLVFGRMTLYVIYAFALLEGLMYGFGLWWVMYLYVWTILYLIVFLFRKNDSVIIWAIISGFFGLSFGALCAIPYAIAGGIGAGLAWWSAGLMFDILHAVGNVVVTLVLFKPLYYVMEKLKIQILERV